MLDITSYFHGYTAPQHELVDRISRLGWQLEKVEDKPEGYIATLSNEHGEKLTRTGNTIETALAQALIFLTKMHDVRRTSAHAQTWTHLLPQIAMAYAKAPVWDYKAAPLWKALIDDSTARAAVFKKELKVEHSHHPVPYATAQDIAKDVKAGKIKIPTHDIKHPIWTPEQHLDHRLVHAILGQLPAGGTPHSWVSTNQAVAHHMGYLSDAAKRALFTEHLGHKAYNTHFAGLGPKKIATLDEFIKPSGDLQDGEPIENSKVPFTHKEGSVNKDWESGIEPDYPNAFITNDPLDFITLQDKARKLTRNWPRWDKIAD